MRRFILLRESDIDGDSDVEHFLDNDVDPAERATAFLGSGDCGGDRSTPFAGSLSSAKELNDMRCGCSQDCLRKLSSDDVESSRLNVMEMKKEERDLFVFVLGIMHSQRLARNLLLSDCIIWGAKGTIAFFR